MSNSTNPTAQDRSRTQPSAAMTSPAREHRRRFLRPVIWTAGFIAVAGMVIAACSTSSTDTADGVAETGSVEVIGSPLAPFDQPDPALGTTAPVIVAETYEGDQLRLGDDGVARVIGFFAHWCRFCQAELPRLVEWLEDIAVPEGVEVVAISTAVNPDRDNYPPSEWFEREGYQGILLRDSEDQALATSYGLVGFPYWTVIGADGSVLSRVPGEIDTETYEALLAQAAASS